ncbi:hypothetical protein R1flu_002784 [Riccia fluitans]|uniref:Uncharacterized protein n=1 Tax=Riccia fluitans TaxID=41844 RepID=A0ABD1YAW9_9MARC
MGDVGHVESAPGPSGRPSSETSMGKLPCSLPMGTQNVSGGRVHVRRTAYAVGSTYGRGFASAECRSAGVKRGSTFSFRVRFNFANHARVGSSKERATVQAPGGEGRIASRFALSPMCYYERIASLRPNESRRIQYVGSAEPQGGLMICVPRTPTPMASIGEFHDTFRTGLLQDNGEDDRKARLTGGGNVSSIPYIHHNPFAHVGTNFLTTSLGDDSKKSGGGW